MDREVFRDNLRRLAAAQGLDFDSLALSLRYSGADKKWLRRLWNDGLAAINKKRIRHLRELAQHLGLGLYAEEELWSEDHGKREEIRRISTLTFDYIKVLEKLKENYPDEMKILMGEFPNERVLISEWVADYYGINTNPNIKEFRKKITLLMEEYQDASAISAILGELKSHTKEWDYWSWSVGGDEMAEHLVKQTWRDALLENGEIDPDDFAVVFRKRFFGEN